MYSKTPWLWRVPSAQKGNFLACALHVICMCELELERRSERGVAVGHYLAYEMEKKWNEMQAS